MKTILSEILQAMLFVAVAFGPLFYYFLKG